MAFSVIPSKPVHGSAPLSKIVGSVWGLIQHWAKHPSINVCVIDERRFQKAETGCDGERTVYVGVQITGSQLWALLMGIRGARDRRPLAQREAPLKKFIRANPKSAERYVVEQILRRSTVLAIGTSSQFLNSAHAARKVPAVRRIEGGDVNGRETVLLNLMMARLSSIAPDSAPSHDFIVDRSAAFGLDANQLGDDPHSTLKVFDLDPMPPIHISGASIEHIRTVPRRLLAVGDEHRVLCDALLLGDLAASLTGPRLLDELRKPRLLEGVFELARFPGSELCS